MLPVGKCGGIRQPALWARAGSVQCPPLYLILGLLPSPCFCFSAHTLQCHSVFRRKERTKPQGEDDAIRQHLLEIWKVHGQQRLGIPTKEMLPM